MLDCSQQQRAHPEEREREGAEKASGRIGSAGRPGVVLAGKALACPRPCRRCSLALTRPHLVHQGTGDGRRHGRRDKGGRGGDAPKNGPMDRARSNWPVARVPPDRRHRRSRPGACGCRPRARQRPVPGSRVPCPAGRAKWGPRTRHRRRPRRGIVRGTGWRKLRRPGLTEEVQSTGAVRASVLARHGGPLRRSLARPRPTARTRGACASGPGGGVRARRRRRPARGAKHGVLNASLGTIDPTRPWGRAQPRVVARSSVYTFGRQLEAALGDGAEQFGLEHEVAESGAVDARVVPPAGPPEHAHGRAAGAMD